MGDTSEAKPSLGIHPVGMKKAVIKPQAMNAPMLGMIIPANAPPIRCSFSFIIISFFDY
jgi:hypothetical protein